MTTYDPFAADEAKPAQTAGPAVDSGDNWVSFSFASAPGYDKIAATVHGAPEFVAAAMGIENFDGKVSTLMQQAIVVDGFFKKWYSEANPGKA